jgi:hypothetical protein
MGRVTRIALALALVAGTAAAQPAAPRATPPGPGDDGTHHREGEYGGVSPDGRPSPDAKRVVPPAATLGWIGYRPGDAGAELFLMAAQPFSVEQRLEDGQVVLTLVGVRKLGRNLRRPLDTRFFDGPLARVAAKVVKARRARRGQPAVAGGVEIRVGFKPGAPIAVGTVRTATEKDGLFYLYLGFAGASPAADNP